MTEFEQECIHHHGKVLTGKFKHWCPDFDYLPIDETCFEFQFCLCDFGSDMEEKNAIKTLFELSSKQD